jgi:hypothetical protein
MITNTNAVILSIDPSIVMVSWTTEQMINTRTFRVYRNDVLQTTVTSTPGIRVYTYKDYTPQLKDLYRIYEYRIEVVETGEVTENFSWDTMYRVFESDIVFRHDYIFHYNAGSPMFLHSERTDSSFPKCPNCWDVTSHRSVGSCPVCLGTGRQHPYYDPVLMWVEFGGDSKILDVSSVEVQPGQKRLTASGLPRLKPGDVMHEPFKHELWLVENAVCIGRDTAPVLQQAACKLMERSHEHYKYLTLTDADMASLLTEMNSVNNERRF